jgi:hypothetical protein
MGSSRAPHIVVASGSDASTAAVVRCLKKTRKPGGIGIVGGVEALGSGVTVLKLVAGRRVEQDEPAIETVHDNDNLHSPVLAFAIRPNPFSNFERALNVDVRAFAKIPLSEVGNVLVVDYDTMPLLAAFLARGFDV